MELTQSHNGDQEGSIEVRYYTHQHSTCTVHLFSDFVGISNLRTNPNYSGNGKAQALIIEVMKLFPNLPIKGTPENAISEHICDKLGVIAI